YVRPFDAMEKGDFETTLLRFEENFSRPGWALTNGLCRILFSKAIEGDKKAIEFLEFGSSKNTVITSNFKAPLLFSKLNIEFSSSGIEKSKSELFQAITLGKDTSYLSGLFYLASYQTLVKRGELNKSERLDWIEKMEGHNQITSSYRFTNTKILKNYISMFCFYERFNMTGNNPEGILEFSFWPEEIDDLSYFPFLWHEGDLITLPSVYSMQSELLNFLLHKDSKNEEYLLHYVKLLSAHPDKADFESKYKDDATLNSFLLASYDKFWPTLPRNSRIDSFINNHTSTGSWLLIENWGTWCGPCVRKLPEISKLGKTFERLAPEKIKLISYSYQSSNLEEFMAKNEYTFPVLELNKQEREMMPVNSWPTLLLVSPAGKYLKINWSLYSQDLEGMIFNITGILLIN
ncbi:MAG: thiol-disulfide isomerase/thioredoxin, partial [Sphingobacteriales bacterium]